MNRIGDSLAGKRVLIVQANDFMGPVLCDAFRTYGAEVIADDRTLDAPDAVHDIARNAGVVDVFIGNMAVPAPQTAIDRVSDDEWRTVFSHLVDPLPRIGREIIAPMVQRKTGKVLIMGSATAFRGQRRISTYSAARGAQVSWVRTVGVEVAAQNVQVNLIAQNFVENPTYYPPEVIALPAFQERMKREVPLGRLATAEEDALFAVFLASSEVNFFVGQSIPFSGGWVN